MCTQPILNASNMYITKTSSELSHRTSQASFNFLVTFFPPSSWVPGSYGYMHKSARIK